MSEQFIKLDKSCLEVVLQLNRMTNVPLREVMDYALEQITCLTQSKIGYIALVNEDETVLTMYAWSKSAMAECRIADKPIIYPLESTGLWGEAVRQRKPVITNDYAAPHSLKKGYPEGHVHH